MPQGPPVAHKPRAGKSVAGKRPRGRARSTAELAGRTSRRQHSDEPEACAGAATACSGFRAPQGPFELRIRVRIQTAAILRIYWRATTSTLIQRAPRTQSRAISTTASTAPERARRQTVVKTLLLSACPQSAISEICGLRAETCLRSLGSPVAMTTLLADARPSAQKTQSDGPEHDRACRDAHRKEQPFESTGRATESKGGCGGGLNAPYQGSELQRSPGIDLQRLHDDPLGEYSPLGR